MRSLSVAKTRSWNLPFACLTAVAFDADQDYTYALSEKEDLSDVDIEIFKLVGDASPEELPFPLAAFRVSVFSGGQGNGNQVVSFRFLSEAQSLAVITLGGEIGLVSIGEGEEEGLGQFEVIGSIDAGIVSASWCPDDSLVVVVTDDNKLILMTSTFDVLSEAPLRSSDKGEAQQVNVGWGSKQTQFHGSLGKAAAQAAPASVDTAGSSPDDDTRPRVTWRGDGSLFAVSALEQPEAGGRALRVLRVYDRQGALQSTAEPVAGLEHALAWRPSGNLIAGTQRFGFEGGGAGRAGRHDVVFFERNGLRHREFVIREDGQEKEGVNERRWGYKVRELLWNADSNVLAVWMERDEGDLIQLWTTGNYHWYLKQEILAPSSGDVPGRFSSVSWHPETALRLLLTTSECAFERIFAWEIHISRAQAPKDSGSVAVVDGNNILLTPFRTQNVPPPMASCKLVVGEAKSNVQIVRSLDEGRTPIHVAFSPTGDHFAVLSHTGTIQLWNLHTRIEFGREKALDLEEICSIDLKASLEDREPRQICLWEIQTLANTFRVACLASSRDTDAVIVFIVANNDLQEPQTMELPCKDGRLINSDLGIYWQSPEGKIFSVPLSGESPVPIASFPYFCFSAECTSLLGTSPLFIGRADSGKLYCAASDPDSAHLIAGNSTSFTVAAGFVIYTTAAHEAFFAPLVELRSLLSSGAKGGSEEPQWERRRVERGSRIVTAVPSSMSLVLQMPRGNLETINPRPMVLVVVRQDIDAGNYRKAFLACRRHRIDLSILVEHDTKAFLENIVSFVEQIDEVDHLNLFLTSLGQSSLDTAKLSDYCDAVRVQLESRSLTKYVNSILTAYVVKKPADYEAGLSLLLRLRDFDPELVEEAVKYIIFLVDADKLFDTALGMYDFSLVLLIAQHSQRDPREYLPFLRELRALPKFYQRHKIDDYLKRITSALRNLCLAGSDYFEEALVYIEKHKLYHGGLSLWKGNEEQYKRVLDLYGEYLFDRREFRQAALVFVEAHNLSKALVAYERALLWRELFDLATHENIDEETISSMAHRVADDLLAKKRFDEAARVFLDYAKNTRQCVAALVQGNLFSEARRLVTLHSVPELLEEIVHPAALDSRTQIAEDLEEMRGQLQKQIARLRELRIKKTEEPDAFYGLEDDPTLHSVDVMTDVSMAPTAFTRYTVAPTSTSRASKRTSRSKRKMERKVGSGRKGTIDEEEYLLKSLGKLVIRFDSVQDDTSQLLPHLLQFTSDHRDEARALQTEITAFRTELQAVLDEVWMPKPGEPGELDASSWAERMEEKRRERESAVKSISKPEIGTAEAAWKAEVLDI